MAKDIAKSDRDDEDLTGDMPCKVFGCRRTALFESEFCLDHMRYHNNPGLQYDEYPEVGQPTPNTQSADPVAGSESKNSSQWWDINKRVIGMENTGIANVGMPTISKSPCPDDNR